MKTPVLVAGCAGASLGTEIMRCLNLAGEFDIFCCDRSPYATGATHDYIKGFFVTETQDYHKQLIDFCRRNGIGFIIPGAQELNKILSDSRFLYEDTGVVPVLNTLLAVNFAANKVALFRQLTGMDINTPWSVEVNWECEGLKYPCIIKPSTGSGGSVGVAIVKNQAEAQAAFQRVAAGGALCMAQEYIPYEYGEYTVGILNAPENGIPVSRIAMRRIFPSKLSVIQDNAAGLISSGYTQGIIDTTFNFEVCDAIARAVDSRGPINIQGRIRHDGTFIPFEINSRFSASCFMRALAGRNEPWAMMRMLLKRGCLDTFTPLVNGMTFLRDFATVKITPKQT